MQYTLDEQTKQYLIQVFMLDYLNIKVQAKRDRKLGRFFRTIKKIYNAAKWHGTVINEVCPEMPTFDQIKLDQKAYWQVMTN